MKMNHFYVAVDKDSLKLSTLVELLDVLARNVPGIPIAIFCTSRDVLDTVLGSLLSLGSIEAFSLHSDQAEDERAAIISEFEAAVSLWQQRPLEQAEDASHKDKLTVLVTTDVCAPPVHHLPGERSLHARLLLNYDIPHKKELYARRIGSCFSSSAASAFMKAVTAASTGSLTFGDTAAAGLNAKGKPTSLFCVSAMEIAALRTLEESMGQIITEMPIDFCELLAST